MKYRYKSFMDYMANSYYDPWDSQTIMKEYYDIINSGEEVLIQAWLNEKGIQYPEETEKSRAKRLKKTNPKNRITL